MLRHTGSNVCIFALAFAALALAKPPPQSWSSSGSPGPVFTRSLGPPFGAPGISSISVPYKPKASPFAPKFVDPTAMIAKKTDMLTNLFSGLGPIDFAAISAASSKYPSDSAASPLLYAAVDENPEVKQVDAGVEQVNEKDTMKRGVVAKGGAKVASPKLSPFSPFGPKFSPFAPQFSSFAPSFSPYGPSFAPGASGFPFAGFPSNFAGPGSDSDAFSTRRRRSIVGAAGDGGKALGPPPAYPGLAPIAEEPESLESKLLKLYNPSAGGAKEMLPGMFGPFGPFSPYAAAPYDPMMFMPKTPKATFLDTLFKSLATSTPATSDVVDELPVTELPVPKSTIVPPGFWAPSAIIPNPTEYTDKVSTFLDKLFSSLLLNKTATATADEAGKTVLARSLIEDPEKGKLLVSRSIEDVKNIAAAKDTIVDSIISELGDLKSNMIGTLNDYILYEKTLPVAKASKKPLKPVSPFAAFFAPPTPDPSLPFKQRMAVLSDVFDMLTGLEKNISTAVQEAIKSSTDAPVAVASKPGDDESLETVQDSTFAGIPDFNATLLDAIKSRLANLDKAIATGLNKPVGGPYYAAPAKRNVEDEDYFIPESYENHRDDNHDQYKRAVQMQMHQGYQSMPPGTIESVQAGGGTVPGHQGGGIKLLNSQNFENDWEKSSAWAEYFKNQNEGRKHHHNHH